MSKQPPINQIPVLLSFVKAINARDVAALKKLITGGHQLILVNKEVIHGKENALAYWIALFDKYPRYYIEITHTAEDDALILLLGFLKGFTLQPKNGGIDELPAMWKAAANREGVVMWKEYHDLLEFPLV